ncbi:MAG: enoyl-CoA hydratase/isomerase family protein [Aeromicrobium sp.]
MTYESLSLSVDHGVAHLRLERPHASNAFDLPFAREFCDAVEEISSDPMTVAVAITGAGKRFCAGGDVDSMVREGDVEAYLLELATVLDGALQILAQLCKPVVAGVQGAVAGAGLGLMLCADLIVADRSTKFLTAYAGIGLTPDCGVSYLLPRAIGQQRALELALTGRVLNSDEALSWGLINRVVESDAGDHAVDLARELAAGPSQALGETRRLLRQGWAATRAESGASEAQMIARISRTPDAVRLLSDFGAN